MLSERDIWKVLGDVPDPEIPVLTVLDLGIVRSVRVEAGRAKIAITPTYSGCPATETIAADIRDALIGAGCTDPEIETRLRPAWTTDWISKEGKEKLLAYGIAPPIEPSPDAAGLFGALPAVSCPRCNSGNTVLVSQFGSTPCKALYQCTDCMEPFEYFKCLK